MLKKLFLVILLMCSCKRDNTNESSAYEWRAIEVTASAYNSVPWQTTEENSNIAAWGDTLKPGMKSIAVSRDLLKMGFTHNTMVKIGAWPDTFYVKDKMNRRWKKRIDIYMGLDVQKAREWGRKKIDICYAIPLDTANLKNQ